MHDCVEKRNSHHIPLMTRRKSPLHDLVLHTLWDSYFPHLGIWFSHYQVLLILLSPPLKLSLLCSRGYPQLLPPPTLCTPFRQGVPFISSVSNHSGLEKIKEVSVGQWNIQHSQTQAGEFCLCQKQLSTFTRRTENNGKGVAEVTLD
jgi:hypothetical protein